MQGRDLEMSRSKHTRPARVIAADRVRNPRGKRDDESRFINNAQSRLFQDLEIGVEDIDLASIASELRFPRIKVQRPRKGFFHPASGADIRKTITYFGELCSYGVREISLMHSSSIEAADKLTFGKLIVPGKVVLYEQPVPPWHLSGRLDAANASAFERAGATITASADGARCKIDWDLDSLKEFMLFDVLLHEIGHHLVQQFKGKREAQVLRRKDHELSADMFAQRCRELYKSERV